MAHIHAEKMEQYAKDAKISNTPWVSWCFKEPSSTWMPCSKHPEWKESSDYERREYFIYLNEHRIPCPCNKPPALNSICYVVSIDNAQAYYRRITWEDTVSNYKLLRRGLVHSTAEGAVMHANALLSITEKALYNKGN